MLSVGGAQTDSGVLTHIKALADIIDVPVELLTQRIEHYCSRKKKGTLQINTSTVVGSHHTSRGQITTESGNNTTLQATNVEARQVDIVAGHNVNFRDAHNTRVAQGKFTSKGSGGKKKKGQFVEQQQTSVGVKIKADVLNVTAVTGNITVTNPTFEAIETNLKAVEGLVSILLGVNTYLMQATKSSNSVAWNRMGQRTEEHTTYAQPTFTGTVNIESRDTLVQMVQGQANTFFNYIEQHGGALEKKFLSEFHKSEYKKVQGPGQALMAVIAVAMTMITGGAGTALVNGTFLAGNATAIAMLDVAVASVATQATVGTLQNEGNPLKGVKPLLNKDYLRGLGVSLVTAGLTAQIGGAYGIKKPDATFIKLATSPQLLVSHFQYQLLQQTVGTAVRTTLGKESFKGALKSTVTSIGVNTIAAFVANKIGAERWEQLKRGDTVSDYILHKAYHGILGAAKGAAVAALNGEHGDAISKAALGGTIGGVAAEVVAESMRQEATQRAFLRASAAGENANYHEIIEGESQRVRAVAQLTAVTLAAVFNVDTGAAQEAACNAVENNALGSVIYYGVMGGFAVWAACDVYDTYQQQGAEAALLKAGIEITTIMVGNAVVKRGYQIAGKFYPSAELAWSAYIAENPRVAAVAEYCVNKTGRVKDYVTESRVGRFIKDIDQAVEAKFNRWFSKEVAVDGSLEAERFWTKRIEFKGNKVYQRDDLIDPHFIDEKGLTNLQRMTAGRAPIGVDGKSIELHHMLQTNEGAIAELTQTFHQQYKSVIHINTTDIPSGINRVKFDYWRQRYWIQRAKNFE